MSEAGYRRLLRGVSRQWHAALLSCVVVVAAAAYASAEPRAAVQNPPAPALERTDLYDLQHDEALGGHTLARHVGRTDEQLAERLRREPDISTASTYTDVVTARRAVASAVSQSRDRIRVWASRQGRRPNLVLNYVQGSGTPIGRALVRGERNSRPCDRSLVVLRWLDRQNRWIVLTSYPDLRR